jgi:hypothetical protein
MLNDHMRQATTYLLGAPEPPLKATTAVEKHVTEKRPASLGAARYKTPQPWYCHIIYVLAHPHPGKLNTQEILLQFQIPLMDKHILAVILPSVRQLLNLSPP